MLAMASMDVAGPESSCQTEVDLARLSSFPWAAARKPVLGMLLHVPMCSAASVQLGLESSSVQPALSACLPAGCKAGPAAARPPATMPTRCGVQVGGGSWPSGRSAGGGGSGCSGEGGEGSEGWLQGWEALKGTSLQRWDSWKEQPRRWAEAARSAGEEWHQAARSAGREVRSVLSWQAFEGWQERHWRAFEARQRARLEALTDEQRRRWEELREEGGELWRREIAAFEEWQQRYYGAHDLGAQGRAKPTCPNCRLSFIMLPLLPRIGETLRHFGLRLKAGGGGEGGRRGAKGLLWLLRVG